MVQLWSILMQKGCKYSKASKFKDKVLQKSASCRIADSQPDHV